MNAPLPADPAEAASAAQNRVRSALAVGAAILVGFILVAGFVVILTSVQKANTDDQLDELRRDNARRDQDNAALSQALTEAIAKLDAAGIESADVPTPEEILTEPPVNPAGPDLTELRQVAREAAITFLAEHPADVVTQAELDAAVAAGLVRFCASVGGCRGDPGPVGAAGPEGDEGPPGSTPTAEELVALITPIVAQALADFCAANNGCIGPPGPVPVGPFACTGQVTDFNVVTGTGNYQATCDTTTTTAPP